jgi:hypothetical protein
MTKNGGMMTKNAARAAARGAYRVGWVESLGAAHPEPAAVTQTHARAG